MAETAPAPAPKRKSHSRHLVRRRAAPPRAKAPKPTVAPAPPPPPPPPPPVRGLAPQPRGAARRGRPSALEKDLRARDATCFIGRGKAGSSTEKYRAAGDQEQGALPPLTRLRLREQQTAGRVALPNGALSAAYRLLEAATAKGVTIVADNTRSQRRLQPGRAGAVSLVNENRAAPLHEVTVGSGVWARRRRAATIEAPATDAAACACASTRRWRNK